MKELPTGTNKETPANEHLERAWRRFDVQAQEAADLILDIEDTDIALQTLQLFKTKLDSPSSKDPNDDSFDSRTRVFWKRIIERCDSVSASGQIPTRNIQGLETRAAFDPAVKEALQILSMVPQRYAFDVNLSKLTTEIILGNPVEAARMLIEELSGRTDTPEHSALSYTQKDPDMPKLDEAGFAGQLLYVLDLRLRTIIETTEEPRDILIKEHFKYFRNALSTIVTHIIDTAGPDIPGTSPDATQIAQERFISYIWKNRPRYGVAEPKKQ